MNRSLLKYITALVLFGSNGIIASAISMNSYEIVMFRTLIGSIFLLLMFFLSKNKFSFYKHKKGLLFLLISGIAMGAGWIFLYEAYRLIGVGVASLLYYCGPVLVIAVSIIIFKEKVTTFKIFGFLAVILGIILINIPSFQAPHAGLGVFYAALSAIMYAFMVIFNKKATGIDRRENAALQLCIAFFAVFIFTLCKQSFSFLIPAGSLVPLIILGLVNTGIGCHLYFTSICDLDVQSVAILGYLEPLSAVILSAIFLHEKMTLLQAFGVVLILGGAISAEQKKNNC